MTNESFKEEEITKKNISYFFGDVTKENDSSNDIVKGTNKIEEPQKINYDEIISRIYITILDREPDLGTLKQYSNKLKFGLLTEDQIREELKNTLDTSTNETKVIKSLVTKEHDQLIEQPSEKESSSSSLLRNLNLVYCMIGGNRLNEIKPYLETVLPYVDRLVYIDSFSTDGSSDYIKELAAKTNKVTLIQKEWEDRFSGFRNYYLEYLKSINYDGFCIVSDTDEHFPEETLTRLANLIHDSDNGSNYSGIKFHVEDITVDDNDQNKILDRRISDYWKALMFKYHPDLRYIGEPHETLVGYPIDWIKSDLIYQHSRSKLHVLSNAARNFFISNSNRYSDKWSEFRFLCTNNRILTFKDYWTLFEEHKLPKEIEEWITQHKDDNEDSGDSEVRETYLLYNEVLPKRKIENDNKLKEQSHKIVTPKYVTSIQNVKYDVTTETTDNQLSTTIIDLSLNLVKLIRKNNISITDLLYFIRSSYNLMRK